MIAGRSKATKFHDRNAGLLWVSSSVCSMLVRSARLEMVRRYSLTVARPIDAGSAVARSGNRAWNARSFLVMSSSGRPAARIDAEH